MKISGVLNPLTNSTIIFNSVENNKDITFARLNSTGKKKFAIGLLPVGKDFRHKTSKRGKLNFPASQFPASTYQKPRTWKSGESAPSQEELYRED